MNEVTAAIRQIVEDNYDLGEVVDVTEIKAGDTNNSFLIECLNKQGRKKWYVRQYNPAVEECDIIYEHAFEGYLNGRIDPEIQTVLPIKCRNGKTWVRTKYQGQLNFYAVFNTISGNEPYSWEFNDLSDTAYDSCAEIAAKFHAWSYGFEGPEGSGRREPPLQTQFQVWRKDLPESIIRLGKREKVFKRFTDYLKKEESFILDTIDFCEAELAKYEKKLKVCINHKDLNPGNVMFDDQDRVNAVFDLDWVNQDYRLYDLGWMGYQISASWDTDSWGLVSIEKVKRLIRIYNETMLKTRCPLGGLTPDEVEFMPAMMIIGAMKVIMDFICYEDHEDDVYRVFVNTWRFISSIRYMRDHLNEMIREIKQ